MTTLLDHLEAPALQALFDDLNWVYFRGRLPRYQVVFGQPPGDPTGCSGYCDPDTRTIYVEPTPPTPEGLRRILLHEMCHIGSLGHGKRFQAKLRQLARAGEAWAEQEAAAYAEEIAARRPLTAMVADRIRDIAIEFPDSRWSTVEAAFAMEIGRSVAELRRAAPWAERLFDRESANIRQHQALRENLRHQ